MTFVNTEHLLLAAGTYSPPNIIDFLLREGSIYGDVIMPKTTLVMMVVAIDADDLFIAIASNIFYMRRSSLRVKR